MGAVQFSLTPGSTMVSKLVASLVIIPAAVIVTQIVHHGPTVVAPVHHAIHASPAPYHPAPAHYTPAPYGPEPHATVILRLLLNVLRAVTFLTVSLTQSILPTTLPTRSPRIHS